MSLLLIYTSRPRPWAAIYKVPEDPGSCCTCILVYLSIKVRLDCSSLTAVLLTDQS